MSLKGLVNSPDVYNAFKSYIQSRIDLTAKTLEQATEPHVMYRLQGQIIALRRLLSLRDEVNKGEN